MNRRILLRSAMAGASALALGPLVSADESVVSPGANAPSPSDSGDSESADRGVSANGSFRAARPGSTRGILFTSAGKTGWISDSASRPHVVSTESAASRNDTTPNIDPSNSAKLHAAEHYLEFNVPNQATWQPTGTLPDGRLVLLSMEPRRDGPGRPFDQYYTQTPTHIWAYDLTADKLEELCHRERKAPFYTPALMLGGDRLLVQVVKAGVGQIFSMRLDGTDSREFTREDEGFPYGLSLSPDGKRVAFHTAGPAPHAYRIWTSDPDGANRTLVAGDPAHLFFGPVWSPHGDWLAFADCLYQTDPGHDWADVCVARPDGSELRTLTTGQSHWFGATYGNPEHRGSGSNMLAWTADGAVLHSRKLPGTRVPWQYRADRPDTDHFNRDWQPEQAAGGTEIVRITPDAEVATLIATDPPTWNLRASMSADGKSLVFCRCATGETPAIWIAGANGAHPRLLTRGIGESGADHPRWLERS